jgi:hypothetical protein
MRLATIATIVGIAASVPVLGTMAYAGFAFREEVAANTNWRLLQTYQRLELIKSQRDLTHSEWLEYCAAGKQLNVFTTCPSRKKG